jgi:hypothetical protein
MERAVGLVIESDPITGFPSQVFESLTRSISAYCREDSNVVKLYIGIASGEEPEEAMKRRYDEFKRDEGINHMICLYESSSEDHTRELETYLENYFSEHRRSINRTGGGGGRRSSGPIYYLYIAMRRWG